MQTLKASRKGATEIKVVLLSSSDKSQETDKCGLRFKGDPNVRVMVRRKSQIRPDNRIVKSFPAHSNLHQSNGVQLRHPTIT